MKIKKQVKGLSLNKQTIAHLSSLDLDRAKGGATLTQTCDTYCNGSCAFSIPFLGGCWNLCETIPRPGPA